MSPARLIKHLLEKADWETARSEIRKAKRSTLSNSELVLCCAVHRAPIDILDLLIARGANCNEMNQFNDTPLTLAIWHNNTPQFIAKLIEHGGNVNNRNTNGNCPITLSAEAKVPPEVIRMLLQAGSDVNATNMFGDNCCTLGVWNKTPLELMQIYIQCGVDVNHANVNGNSPVVLAGEINLDHRIVELLIRAGADVNKPNNFGDTALTLCAWKNSNVPLVRTLLSAGADVNQRNITGNSVLSLACEANCSVELVSTLLANGADVSSVNNGGDSAFTLACWKNSSVELVLELLKHGANPFHANHAGKTALMLARENRVNPRLVDLIQQAVEGNLDLARFDLTAINRLLAKTRISEADQRKYQVLFQLANYTDEKSFKRLDRQVLRDVLQIRLQDVNQILKALGNEPPTEEAPITPIAFDWSSVNAIEDKFVFYASYHATAKDRVSKFCATFSVKATGKPVCFASRYLSVEKGISSSAWFVVFLTKQYMDCINITGDGGGEQLVKEFNFVGARKPRNIVICILDDKLQDSNAWQGVIKARLRSKAKTMFLPDSNMDEAVENLARLLVA